MDALSEGFHLFFQSELLPLELLQSDVVTGGSAQFVLNSVFKGLVAGSEFTNPGFHCHDGRPPLLLVAESEHPLCSAVRSHMVADGEAETL